MVENDAHLLLIGRCLPSSTSAILSILPYQMTNSQTLRVLRDKLITAVFGLPWLDIVAEIWKRVKKSWTQTADQGMYEVIDYRSTLELLDKHGCQARINKREQVRYLQNNIMTYQDQAWGDGKILVNYKCSPGIVVDQYRPGDKTYILISLRDIRKRGDVDDFHIQWEQHNGFKRNKEQWSTEVRHRTKRLRLEVVFPKARPPLRAWLEEYLRKRTRSLGQESRRQLPDGRWMVWWETGKPRYHEEYILKWEW